MDVLSVELYMDAMNGEEYAWRVHAALDSWTGKVDTKASIALAIEGAAFGFALSQSREGEALASLDGWHETLYYIGLGFVLLSIGCALLTVFPRLRRRASGRRSEWRKNTIYFGHLRHWDPAELARELEGDNLPHGTQLATQLVSMAKVAWRKHAWLQGSLLSLAVASQFPGEIGRA